MIKYPLCETYADTVCDFQNNC